MARSDAEIGNLALQRVGVTLTIDRLDERTKEASVLNKVFATVREKVLADANWPFARKYQDLNRSGTAPAKWKYSFAYPNDCLAVRTIFPTFQAGAESRAVRKYINENKTPYEIVIDDNENKFICCDQPAVTIEMTVNITNPSRFDSKFASMFAWGLAGEIALPLARDVKYAQNAFSMYGTEKLEAQAASFSEQVNDENPESEFVRERG